MKRPLLLLCAALCIMSSCSDGGETPPPVPPPDLPNGNNLITWFALRITQNGAQKEFTGRIDQYEATIQIFIPGVEWIDDIGSAVAKFTTNGKSVRVGDIVQVSGTTRNDFTFDVTYTVKAGNGEERAYTVDVVSPQSSGLPMVLIDTQGEAPILNKEDYVISTLTIIDPHVPENNIAEAAAGVRGRGNTTWGYPKKPYRVKLDEKASVFGLTSAKNWVLLADWQDPTYIMNSVGFELSRRVGLPFSPTTTHVELFLNGSYQGAYTMCEHIQVNEGRVNIDEFEDVFLEIDTYYDEPYKFRSAMLELPVMFKSPEFEDVSSSERDQFIAGVKADFDAMEQSVMSLDGWRDHMDVASFIDFMIVNELVRNIELGHPKSTYLFKKRDGKWTWGPVWDLDWAYGYSGGGQNYWKVTSSESMLYITGEGFNDAGVSSNEPGVRFFTRLFHDEGFKEEFKARWEEVKPLIDDIDDFVAQYNWTLLESDRNNKIVWATQYPKSFEGEISSMQEWLLQRIKAMDVEISGW